MQNAVWGAGKMVQSAGEQIDTIKTATDANSASRGCLNLENGLFFSEFFQAHQCYS